MLEKTSGALEANAAFFKFIYALKRKFSENQTVFAHCLSSDLSAKLLIGI